MIVEKKGRDKKDSDNPDYNDTERWKNTQTVIKLETKNGGRSTIDELPGGIVQQRIVAQEKLIKNSKLQSAKSASSSATITSSSSEISISSQQSSEENHDIQQKPKKSRIPIRSNSDVSLSSNNSSLSQGLFQSPKIPVRKKKQKDIRLVPKVYEINEKTREALLSVDHPFLKSIAKHKIYEAISFHINDRVRVKNLEDEDIAELRNSKRPMMIFSR